MMSADPDLRLVATELILASRTTPDAWTIQEISTKFRPDQIEQIKQLVESADLSVTWNDGRRTASKPVLQKVIDEAEQMGMAEIPLRRRAVLVAVMAKRLLDILRTPTPDSAAELSNQLTEIAAFTYRWLAAHEWGRS